jgi:hypothetical protein
MSEKKMTPSGWNARQGCKGGAKQAGFRCFLGLNSHPKNRKTALAKQTWT